MKKLWIATAIVLVGALSAFGTIAFASGGDDDEFRASLNGYNEVNSKSTVSRGSFRAELEDGVIEYRLSYANLETPALFAHIHFAQSRVNGGVIAPADIIGPNDQGIEPGSFAEAVRAMRVGATYANVHSERFPGGEIRGQ